MYIAKLEKDFNSERKHFHNTENRKGVLNDKFFYIYK